jgi:hypothetical protein
MDTTKLVVGQDLFIHSGPAWHYKGKVINVTPSGVEVQVPNKTFELEKLTTGASVTLPGNVVRFDGAGTCECGTRECGPWLIDDEMPFAEREAHIEQIMRESRASKQLYSIKLFRDIEQTNRLEKTDKQLRMIQALKDLATTKIQGG